MAAVTLILKRAEAKKHSIIFREVGLPTRRQPLTIYIPNALIDEVGVQDKVQVTFEVK